MLVTSFGLPSLVVTLGTLALFRGLALVVLGSQGVAGLPRLVHVVRVRDGAGHADPVAAAHLRRAGDRPRDGPPHDVARPPAVRDRQERERRAVLRRPVSPGRSSSCSPSTGSIAALAGVILDGSLRERPGRHRPGPHAHRRHDRPAGRREHLRRPGNDPRRRPRGRDARRSRQRPAADERVGRDPEHRRRRAPDRLGRHPQPRSPGQRMDGSWSTGGTRVRRHGRRWWDSQFMSTRRRLQVTNHQLRRIAALSFAVMLVAAACGGGATPSPSASAAPRARRPSPRPRRQRLGRARRRRPAISTSSSSRRRSTTRTSTRPRPARRRRRRSSAASSSRSARRTRPPAEQIPFIQDATTQGYKAIVVSATGADEVAPALKAAKDAGIKVVGYDSSPAEGAYDVFVNQTDFSLIGGAMAQWACDLAPGLHRRDRDPLGDRDGDQPERLDRRLQQGPHDRSEVREAQARRHRLRRRRRDQEHERGQRPPADAPEPQGHRRPDDRRHPRRGPGRRSRPPARSR